jgi:hypothetical protein
MKLESCIRTEINQKLIPLIKKDKCEICGSTENLEVHHVKPFAEILEECLDDLHMKRKDTDTYTQKELHMIIDYVIGKHFRYKMKIVCRICHKNIIHKDGTCNIGNRNHDKKTRENINKVIHRKVINNAQKIINCIKYIIDNKNDPENIKIINFRQKGLLTDKGINKKALREYLGFTNRPIFNRAVREPTFQQFCKNYNINIDNIRLQNIRID